MRSSWDPIPPFEECKRKERWRIRVVAYLFDWHFTPRSRIFHSYDDCQQYSGVIPCAEPWWKPKTFCRFAESIFPLTGREEARMSRNGTHSDSISETPGLTYCDSAPPDWLTLAHRVISACLQKAMFVNTKKLIPRRMCEDVFRSYEQVCLI